MCLNRSAKRILGFLMISLPIAKLSNCPIQESIRLLPSSPMTQPPAMAPGDSGVTPSRAASALDNTEAPDPESSSARTGLPLIEMLSQILEPASIGTSPAGSVAQYASDTPPQSRVS